jgi:hypothetical protein
LHYIDSSWGVLVNTGFCRLEMNLFSELAVLDASSVDYVHSKAEPAGMQDQSDK